ncbi:MAG: hypothetical protein B7Y98_07310 [Sphingomonas sp. 32-62-10]|nr:MAG: hypothetical protein B7Z43_03960 [Sphingomonas sp. 12-62-6]OYX38913.1 MAG: hypothetical protein B7Y98_07310 [Sphingomonas sp. 32-62-10]
MQSAGQTTSAAPKKSADPDIVVSGLINKNKGPWKRAEAGHIIVIGQNSVDELRRITRNIENLHYLLVRLYRRGDFSDSTNKLEITLFDSSTKFTELGIPNQSSKSGYYPSGFSSPVYYSAGENGAVLAIVQKDQLIELNTQRAFNEDCDDYHEDGKIGTCPEPFYFPIVRHWEAELYSLYTQHFIITNNPLVYPSWYVESIGALFSMSDIRRNGSINYARYPAQYKQFFRSYENVNVADILTGNYIAIGPDKSHWTPYHAWLIAHYFVFSKLKPERTQQFRQYMNDINRGKPMAEAANVFGNMSRLQREVRSYAESEFYFAEAKPPAQPVGEPLITPLSPAAVAMIAPKIALSAQLAQAVIAKGYDLPAPTSIDKPERDTWLSRIRGAAEQFDDVDVLSLAAEAECRSGNADTCLAYAERALDKEPENIVALTWKGVALTDKAVTAAPENRPAMTAMARKTLQRAVALDDQLPLPRIAYFQSFTKLGERAPKDAMAGMAEAIQRVPAAARPRLYLGEELVRQGQIDAARRVLHTVLYGAYETPERTAARSLLAPTADGVVSRN